MALLANRGGSGVLGEPTDSWYSSEPGILCVDHSQTTSSPTTLEARSLRLLARRGWINGQYWAARL